RYPPAPSVRSCRGRWLLAIGGRHRRSRRAATLPFRSEQLAVTAAVLQEGNGTLELFVVPEGGDDLAGFAEVTGHDLRADAALERLGVACEVGVLFALDRLTQRRNLALRPAVPGLFEVTGQ